MDPDLSSHIHGSRSPTAAPISPCRAAPRPAPPRRKNFQFVEQSSFCNNMFDFMEARFFA